MWRRGPAGKSTLCNACGLKYAQLKKAFEIQEDPSKTEISGESKKVKTCLHCASTSTPVWRRGPPGKSILCNACGLKYAQLKKLVQTKERSNKTGIISESKKVKACSYCESTSTSVWRRGPSGKRNLCNGCGLKYNRLKKEIQEKK